MNIKIAYADALGLFTLSTGTLTRDLAFSPVGLRKVFDTQNQGRPLAASRTFDISNYVVATTSNAHWATVA